MISDKYDKYVEENSDLLLKFDSSLFIGPQWPTPIEYRKPITVLDVMELGGETWKDRMYRMLRPMSTTCKACSMCDLGKKVNSNGDDPHVFSTMSPSKWMVIGQNPGANECKQGKPFVGAAGEFFDKVIKKNGLSRHEFYISNAVKCYTENNEKPTFLHNQRCRPFIQMEIQLLRPILIVTLGAVAFDVFCPELKLSDHLGKVVESSTFEDQKIYPVYHPSPRNMSVSERKAKFIKDIAKLCKLIKMYQDDNS